MNIKQIRYLSYALIAITSIIIALIFHLDITLGWGFGVLIMLSYYYFQDKATADNSALKTASPKLKLH